MILRLFPILCIVASSCSDDRITGSNSFDFYPKFPDTGSYKSQFVEKRFAENNLFHLSSMLDGVDSFELRIWQVEALSYLPKNVLVFRKNRSWSGSHYNSYNLPHIRDDGTVVKIYGPIPVGDSVFLVKEFTPACGWEKFQDSIQYYEIDKLPTQDSITNFSARHGYVDGSGFDIEIATENSYRFLHYWMPRFYKDPAHSRFNAFIEMVKRQLGKNYCWPVECYE